MGLLHGRFLPLLGDGAVAPTTTLPSRAVGRTLRCAGRRAKCRTASNIDRAASRLGSRSPDRYMRNGHQRAQKGTVDYQIHTYHPHHTSASATPTSIPHPSKLLSTRRYIVLPQDVSAQPHEGALRSRQCTAVLGAAIESWTQSSTFPSHARGAQVGSQVLIVPSPWWCAEAPLPASHCRSSTAAVAAEVSEVRRR